MKRQLRYCHGSAQLVKFPARDKMERGGLVYLSAEGFARPLSLYHEVGLTEFQTRFLGILHTGCDPKIQVGDGMIEVNVDISPLTVYEMDVVNGLYQFGDMFMPDLEGEDADCTLDDHRLKWCSRLSVSRIATAMKTNSTASSTVHVSFMSAFHPASNNAYFGM